ILFHTPFELIGCCLYNSSAKYELNLKKSTVSAAESISACHIVFDCPIIVAALCTILYFDERSSAALKNTAALSSNGILLHCSLAFNAPLIASSIKLLSARCTFATTSL